VQVRRYICGHLAVFLRVKSLPSSSLEKNECGNSRDCIETIDLTLSPSSSSAAAAAAAVSVGQNISSVERLLCSINELLETRVRLDARLRQQTDKNQQMMSEWMIAAAVIDRFCFIVFSFCFLIGTAVLFICAITAPHSQWLLTCLELFSTKFGRLFCNLIWIKPSKFYSDLFIFDIFIIRCLSGYFFRTQCSIQV